MELAISNFRWPLWRSRFRRAYVVVTVVSGMLLHAGCAAPTKQADREPEPVAPVIAALVEDAQASTQRQQYEQAAAKLERALRIEPANPVLWFELARVHFERGSFDAAIQFANKSNTLTSDDELRSKNWRLIAQAYSEKGDHDRAREALEKANAE